MTSAAAGIQLNEGAYPQVLDRTIGFQLTGSGPFAERTFTPVTAAARELAEAHPDSVAAFGHGFGELLDQRAAQAPEDLPVHARGIFLTSDPDQLAAAFYARLDDDGELPTALTLGDPKDLGASMYNMRAANMNGWILLSPDASAPVRNAMTGAKLSPADAAATAELLVHESGHSVGMVPTSAAFPMLGPGTEVASANQALDEGSDEIGARDPALVKQALVDFGWQSDAAQIGNVSTGGTGAYDDVYAAVKKAYPNATFGQLRSQLFRDRTAEAAALAANATPASPGQTP
jgi:hypothetical protein